MISPAELQMAALALRDGLLVAFPTETVYGLGANATDAAACTRIFEAKGRPLSDPLIVHVAPMQSLPSVTDSHAILEELGQSGVINLEAIPTHTQIILRRLIDACWPGPLTLLFPRGPRIPLLITAGREHVAVRMPAHRIAQQLIALAGVPVAAPSANRFGHTSPTTAQHVHDDLGDRVSIILDDGPTQIGIESSVLDVLQWPPVLLRHGGVTRERIEAIVGISVQTSVHAEPGLQTGLAAPGMLEKHYAPQAKLIICNNPFDLRRELTLQRARGHKVGLLLTSPHQADFADDLTKYIVGDDHESMARNLYAGLRALDSAGSTVILALQVERTGLGAAIADRLQRAAA